MTKTEMIILCEHLVHELDVLVERIQAVDVDSNGKGNFKSNNSPEELTPDGKSKTQLELKQAYNILKTAAPDIFAAIKSDSDSTDLKGSDLSIEYRSPTGTGQAKVVVAAYVGGVYSGCVDLETKKFFKA